jgi:hypothetical protein
MVVGAEPDEGPEGRGKQRQCEHHRYQSGRHTHLDDHDAIEGANQHDQCHANRDLKK